MKKFLSILIFALSSLGAFAKPYTYCVCQIGEGNAIETTAFKAGCKLWFSKHLSCDEKKIVERMSQVKAFISLTLMDRGALKIGYVGHTRDLLQSEDLLDEVIQRTKDYPVEVEIDNTACYSMIEPFETQALLTKAKSNGHQAKITFKGTQVVSIGLWEKLPMTSKNFWSTVSTESKTVVFPQCQEFEGKSCSIFMSEKSSGLCSDKGKLQELECLNRKWVRKSSPDVSKDDIEHWENNQST